ncbi:MAG TPA: hypothetical protein VGA13_09755 [Acidimicrobiales bacterium]
MNEPPSPSPSPSPSGETGDPDFSTPQIVILASAVLLVFCSFLPWWEFGSGDRSVSQNAWESFPLFVWPMIFGLIAGLYVLSITVAKGLNLPDLPFGFTWVQGLVVCGLIAVLETLAFVIGADQQAIGAYLSFLAAIGLLVGAVMMVNEA